MGKSGLATSFFNDKNRSLSAPLVELLVESHQELPGWLENVRMEARGGYGNKRGGGRYGSRAEYEAFHERCRSEFWFRIENTNLLELSGFSC